MLMPAAVSLALSADALDQALAWLDHTGQQRQWPARTQFRLRLCLEEILTNLAMHGVKRTAMPRVELRLQQTGNQLTLAIRDNGIAFDPTSQPKPQAEADLDTAEPGGQGLRLLHHYIEEMHYERHDGWNLLELVTRLDDA